MIKYLACLSWLAARPSPIFFFPFYSDASSRQNNKGERESGER